MDDRVISKIGCLHWRSMDDRQQTLYGYTTEIFLTPDNFLLYLALNTKKVPITILLPYLKWIDKKIMHN